MYMVERILSSQNTPLVCLWKENPNRLVTLWDIVKTVKPDLLIEATQKLWIDAGMMPPVGHSSREALFTHYRKGLTECQGLCDQFQLSVSAMKVQSAIDFCSLSPDRVDASKLERAGQIITTTICEEMSLRKYFEVEPERSKHYIDAEPFGPVVASSFPSTSFDGIEARRCFALARNTACVFHLMRVMEIGLTVFANRFIVPSDHTNWHNIIEGIEKAVRNMGADPNKSAHWKDEQEFYSQAASHFMVTKDAWRNHTAHARGKYTDEEAETILINVRGFMQRLATRLHE